MKEGRREGRGGKRETQGVGGYGTCPSSASWVGTKASGSETMPSKSDYSGLRGCCPPCGMVRVVFLWFRAGINTTIFIKDQIG